MKAAKSIRNLLREDASPVQFYVCSLPGCPFRSADKQDVTNHELRHRKSVQLRAADAQSKRGPLAAATSTRTISLPRTAPSRNLSAPAQASVPIKARAPPAPPVAKKRRTLVLEPDTRLPLACTVEGCRYTSVVPSYLKSHLRNHGKAAGEVFTCDVCHYNTLRRADIAKHRASVHKQSK